MVIFMILKKTKSLCPVCLDIVDADVYEDQDKIMIRKECKIHGKFENTYWSNSEKYYIASDYDYTGKGVDNPRTICRK